MTKQQTTSTSVALQWMPRDSVDAIQLTVLSLVFGGAFAGLAWLLSVGFFGTTRYVAALVLLLLSPVALIAVFAVRVDDEGIAFSRVVGLPRRLAWSQIVDVSVPTTSTLLKHGFFALHWPPRAISMTSTLQGYVGVRYRLHPELPEDTIYFAPVDADAFIALVDAHRLRVDVDAHSSAEVAA